jgi:hypothetical protein
MVRGDQVVVQMICPRAQRHAFGPSNCDFRQFVGGDRNEEYRLRLAAPICVQGNRNSRKITR